MERCRIPKGTCEAAICISSSRHRWIRTGYWIPESRISFFRGGPSGRGTGRIRATWTDELSGGQSGGTFAFLLLVSSTPGTCLPEEEEHGVRWNCSIRDFNCVFIHISLLWFLLEAPLSFYCCSEEYWQESPEKAPKLTTTGSPGYFSLLTELPPGCPVLASSLAPSGNSTKIFLRYCSNRSISICFQFFQRFDS